MDMDLSRWVALNRSSGCRAFPPRPADTRTIEVYATELAPTMVAGVESGEEVIGPVIRGISTAQPVVV
jgi:hypothetical protein